MALTISSIGLIISLLSLPVVLLLDGPFGGWVLAVGLWLLNWVAQMATNRFTGDLQAVAAVGLEHVACVQFGQLIVHDELEIGAARQHAPGPAVAPHRAAGDGNQAAPAVGDLAHLDGRVHQHRQVGEESEARFGPHARSLGRGGQPVCHPGR